MSPVMVSSIWNVYCHSNRHLLHVEKTKNEQTME